jgi:hypothetical protein
MKNYPLFALFFFSLRCICQAQVPVSQEAMHHKVLDNGHVRLLDVHIPPGDTTEFHIHATPSVFLLLTEANTGSQVISEEDRSGSPVTHYGNIWFEGFYVKPRIHRVYNHDSHEYRVMDIELTNKNYILIDPPIQQEAFTFLFEEKPVRVYRLNLGPTVGIYLPERKADILLIQLSDSVNSVQVNEKSFTQKGGSLYIPSGKPISLKNGGAGNAVFAFFELK